MRPIFSLVAFVGVLFFLLAPAAMAQEPTAADYIELFKPLVGAWKSVITEGDKTVDATFVFRLSRTNTCFVSYGEGGTMPPNQAIHGYDPVAKQWKSMAYDAEGGYAVTSLTVQDMKKGKVLGTDYRATSEIARYSKDGKKTTSSDRLMITAYDQDRIEAVVTDRKEDGKPQPDIKFVMERQPRRARSPRP